MPNVPLGYSPADVMSCQFPSPLRAGSATLEGLRGDTSPALVGRVDRVGLQSRDFQNRFWAGALRIGAFANVKSRPEIDFLASREERYLIRLQ